MFLGITEHNWLDVKVCLETSQEDKIIQKTAHEIFDRYICNFTIYINFSNLSVIFYIMLGSILCYIFFSIFSLQITSKKKIVLLLLYFNIFYASIIYFVAIVLNNLK